MNKQSKVLSVTLGAVFAAGVMAFFSGCAPTTPPEADHKVHSVTLTYGEQDVGATLNVDISLGALTLVAEVEKDEGADGTVTWTSSETSVATVDGGVVTLLDVGETAITATAGDVSDSFVLVVGGTSSANAYAITVVGGRALDEDGEVVTSAKAGTYLVLEPTIDLDHNEFLGWEFDDDSGLWINGNTIKMPARALNVTATSTPVLYALQVIGGTVKTADGKAPQGEDKGYTSDGETDEYKITEYKIAYGTEVTLSAADDPADKMFVGWDYGYESNRVGNAGEKEYTFDMGDEALTKVWAVYTALTKDVVNSMNSAFKGQGYKTIKNGTPEGEANVPEFGGLNGYVLSIPGNTTRDTKEHSNGCSRLGIDNITKNTHHGQYTIKIVLRNRSEKYRVVLELEAEYNGLKFKTGELEVKPGETVTYYRTLEIGFQRPDCDVHVRNNIGGTAEERVLVDMAIGAAPSNPGIDGRLVPNGIPQYVTFVEQYEQDGCAIWGSPGQWGLGGGWTDWRPKFIDNEYGVSTILYLNSPSKDAFIMAKINNLPEYQEDVKTTVYVKLINLYANDESYGGKDLALAFCTDQNFTGAEVIRQDFKLDPGVETQILKFELPRTASDTYFVRFINTQSQGSFGFCVQFTYNNVFGYEEA